MTQNAKSCRCPKTAAGLCKRSCGQHGRTVPREWQPLRSNRGDANQRGCRPSVTAVVLVHMIGCGGNMMTLRRTRVYGNDGPGKGDEAKAVGEAFGFGHEGPGRSIKLRDSSYQQRDSEIALHVGGLIQAGTKKDFAYDVVAKRFGLTRMAVRRAWAKAERLGGQPTAGHDTGHQAPLEKCR
jgi:hypothetical protein